MRSWRLLRSNLKITADLEFDMSKRAGSEQFVESEWSCIWPQHVNIEQEEPGKNVANRKDFAAVECWRMRLEAVATFQEFSELIPALDINKTFQAMNTRRRLLPRLTQCVKLASRTGYSRPNPK